MNPVRIQATHPESAGVSVSLSGSDLLPPIRLSLTSPDASFAVYLAPMRAQEVVEALQQAISEAVKAGALA